MNGNRFRGLIRTFSTVAIIGMLGSAAAPVARADEDAIAKLQAMSDTIKAARSISFVARVFFDEIHDDHTMSKRFATYNVFVRHPDILAFEVKFDDGTRRTGVFNGKELLMALPARKSFSRFKLTGSISTLIGYMQDNLGLNMPLADFLFQDMMAAHEPNIQNVANLGERRFNDTTLDHIAIEGAGASWQLWLDRSQNSLPLRFVAKFIRVAGAPEFMATFTEWEINEEEKDIFITEVPDDWTEYEMVEVDEE